MADKSQKAFTESDMEAAQQLMQLSDEDNNNLTSMTRKRTRHEEEEDGEVEQRVISHATLAKIQEIFGKDEVLRPKKQRRYRSLVNIYMTTTPIHANSAAPQNARN